MSSIWKGENLEISIFGESHGLNIGAVIDGLPVGEKLNFDKIQEQLKKRAPNKDKISSSRKEKDIPIVISGLQNNITTGVPLCTIFKNEDIKSEDYKNIKGFLRPGHADYTSYVKYKGFNDKSGGGHFSGRLTCPLVFAGAICKQILEKKDISISSEIQYIGEIVKDDSAGGIIECRVEGVPAGIGSPMFDGLESAISSIVFSIPGIKGIEFGSGFKSAYMKGSENNDEFILDNGKIKTKTNNHGGILGGISSGMPIVFRVAVKPTPSISKTQNTVNIKNLKEETIKISGRHDQCIVPRVAPVIEAVVAIIVLDKTM